MNIKEAKQQIKNTITAYLTKDENGRYLIPTEKQRPVFLLGAPGIGKTAIMKQIAEEVGIGLLSYSMTHHTRQSVLGLPFIEHKTYGGKEYSISEYTMSEIIASVYDVMEVSGIKEGILFIDEINCVSETLAPIMLQFLQYKVFGRHRVPDGWIVVAAGNPPEYNDSVREFDVATWDRLKRVDVTPDFEVWKEFAYKTAVHPTIITYLSIKRNNFYDIASTVDGKTFVTARGWDDLSQMIYLYEKNDIEVDIKLISQYLQNKKIAADFANYYALYNKYKNDYQIETIMQGKADDTLFSRAQNANFDEKYSLIGLLLDGNNAKMRAVVQEEKAVVKQMEILRHFAALRTASESPVRLLEQVISQKEQSLQSLKVAGGLSLEDEVATERAIATLREKAITIAQAIDHNIAVNVLKKDITNAATKMKQHAQEISAMLSNTFHFCDEVFGEQEISIFMVELTANPYSAEFVSKYGCPEYFAHNKNLLIYERGLDIVKQIEQIYDYEAQDSQSGVIAYKHNDDDKYTTR